MTRLVRPAEERMPRAVRRRFAREYEAIANANPELRRLDRRLAGLYLIPATTEVER